MSGRRLAICPGKSIEDVIGTECERVIDRDEPPPGFVFFPDLNVGAHQSTHHGLRVTKGLRVSAKRAPISGNEHGSYPPGVPRSSGAGHRAELDGLTELSLRQLVPERDWSCRRKEQIGGSSLGTDRRRTDCSVTVCAWCCYRSEGSAPSPHV